MTEEEKKRAKPTHSTTLIASVVLGAIFLLIPLIYNGLIVSDIYIPTHNTRPVSLVCSITIQEFSKRNTISNITSEEMTLLSILNGEYAIPTSELEFQEIGQVGIIRWKDHGMFGVLPFDTLSGDYTLDHGRVMWQVHKIGAEGTIPFLVVEALHPVTEVERAILDYGKPTRMILMFILGTSLCLILVPLLDIMRNIEITD